MIAPPTSPPSLRPNPFDLAAGEPLPTGSRSASAGSRFTGLTSVDRGDPRRLPEKRRWTRRYVFATIPEIYLGEPNEPAFSRNY